MKLLSRLNVALRGVMELGIVVALGTWGYQLSPHDPVGVALMLAVPLLAFGFWGLVDFRSRGHLSEPLRLGQELLISGAAAFAWYATGAHPLGWALGAVSLVHHVLVYASGSRLLKTAEVDSG